jgi:hypothetical protein
MPAMPRGASTQGAPEMTSSSTWLKAAAFIIAAALVLFPLTQTVAPPLVDLPNHLAKVHLALSLPGNADLATYYQYQWHIVPNLALDVFVPTLSKIFGLYPGMRIFIGWSLLQIVLGVCLLRYAVHGAVGWWPLATLVLLYNAPLSWGFFNNLFTAGLALIFFAVWILLADRRPVLRTPLFAAILPAMFFLHLVGTAVLCLCIATYQLQYLYSVARSPDTARDKRRVLFSEIFASGPAFLIVFVLWIVCPSGEGESLFYHRGLITLVEAVLSSFSIGGGFWDYALALAVITLTIVALVSRQLTVSRRLSWPLLCLALIALVMPEMLLGATGMHQRLPFVIGCILIASVQVQRPNRLFSSFAIGLVAVLCTLRLGAIGLEWRQFDAKVQQFRAAMTLIKPGSKILTAFDSYDRDAWRDAKAPPLAFLHFSAFAVIEASAFDPLVNSDPRHTNVTVRKAFSRLDTLQGIPATTRLLNRFVTGTNPSGPNGPQTAKALQNQYLSNWPRDFDYLIRISFLADRPEIKGKLTLVKSESWFDLYRIERP